MPRDITFADLWLPLAESDPAVPPMPQLDSMRQRAARGSGEPWHLTAEERR